MFACPKFFLYWKPFLVDVTVAERGQVGIQEESHTTICVEFFLTPFPTSVPISDFSLFPNTNVSEQVGDFQEIVLALGVG